MIDNSSSIKAILLFLLLTRYYNIESVSAWTAKSAAVPAQAWILCKLCQHAEVAHWMILSTLRGTANYTTRTIHNRCKMSYIILIRPEIIFLIHYPLEKQQPEQSIQIPAQRSCLVKVPCKVDFLRYCNIKFFESQSFIKMQSIVVVAFDRQK